MASGDTACTHTHTTEIASIHTSYPKQRFEVGTCYTLHVLWKTNLSCTYYSMFLNAQCISVFNVIVACNWLSVVIVADRGDIPEPILTRPLCWMNMVASETLPWMILF